MAHPLVAYLQRRDRLSETDVATIEDLTRRTEHRKRGATLVEQGSEPTHSCLIMNGMAVRERFFRDGRRMIIATHVQGDFVDLHSLLLKTIDHGVVATTDIEVSWVPHNELRRVTEENPHLARLLWMAASIDAATTRTWLAVIGRLSPEARFAHLVCEMYMRLKAVDAAEDLAFDLPITQADVADMFGLSTVHLNRCLQSLRASGTLIWDGKRVDILDWDELVGLAEFDPTYLDLHRVDR
jgi:CRP-like cAMP-binding protein